MAFHGLLWGEMLKAEPLGNGEQMLLCVNLVANQCWMDSLSNADIHSTVFNMETMG